MHGSTSGPEVQKTGPLQSTSAFGVMCLRLQPLNQETPCLSFDLFCEFVLL